MQEGEGRGAAGGLGLASSWALSPEAVYPEVAAGCGVTANREDTLETQILPGPCVSSEVPTTAPLHLPPFHRGGQQGQHFALFPCRGPRLVAPSSNFLTLGPGIPTVHVPSCLSLQESVW